MLLLLGAAIIAVAAMPGAVMTRIPPPTAGATPGIIIVPNIGPHDRMSILDPNSAAPASCPATSRYEAARRGGKLKSRNLNELPAADAYKAVFRHIDKCLAPIIVRYGVGER
ncbi:MAG TPA: hypothetical protein VFG41_05340 [Sphingomicrobium sp.]|jgi:hypothetical protein|nr:hypothetical protein [Sphingomicrobium sp.]